MYYYHVENENVTLHFIWNRMKTNLETYIQFYGCGSLKKRQGFFYIWETICNVNAFSYFIADDTCFKIYVYKYKEIMPYKHFKTN